MEKDGIELHVHHRRDAEVWFGRWRGGESLGTARCSLHDWLDQCAGSTIIQYAEDCPPDVVEWLEYPYRLTKSNAGKTVRP